MTHIHHHHYDNGLNLFVEPMPGVASVAISFILPAGVACEPADRLGVAAVLSESIFRGAGNLDAKAHSDALDLLGVKRSSSVHCETMRISATLLGDTLDHALPLLCDMVRRPQLSDEAFEPARELAIQSIDALEDDPQQKVMIELKKAHLPGSLGRSILGEREHLATLTNEQLRQFHAASFVPGGAIIGVAGAVSFEQVRDALGEQLASWSGHAPQITTTGQSSGAYRHIESPSAQHHIGLAYEAPPESDPQSMMQHLAVALLSGGMGARLFTEVREKRGLCYSVHASYASLRDRGMVIAYAGTTPQRAGETLDVLTAELRRLAEGASADEFDRAVVGLKTRLIMQGESTGARASAIATDFQLLGRTRSLEDLAAEIDRVSLDELNAYLASHRPKSFTTLTIGPTALA